MSDERRRAALEAVASTGRRHRQSGCARSISSPSGPPPAAVDPEVLALSDDELLAFEDAQTADIIRAALRAEHGAFHGEHEPPSLVDDVDAESYPKTADVLRHELQRRAERLADAERVEAETARRADPLTGGRRRQAESVAAGLNHGPVAD